MTLSWMNAVVELTLVVFFTTAVSSDGSNYVYPKCLYGERGSLTATCVNATPSTFRLTAYRFDHLDETLRCLNCSLETVDTGTFDLSGNQIINLDLKSSKIKYLSPRAFIGLVFLENLDLAQNEIHEIVPGVFIGVKKVRNLDIQENAIHSLVGDAFQELTNLETLNLRRNKISSIDLGAFKGLNHLKVLDLGQNQIKNVKNVFSSLPVLEILVLEFNQISSFDGSEFRHEYPSLMDLNMANNKITAIPSGEFKAMSNLRYLDLSSNAINKIFVGSFHGLRSVESLSLDHNAIQIIPKFTFESLHNVRDLDLSFNALTTFQISTYTVGLPELRSLNLSHNHITTIRVTGTFSLHSLHSLDLSSNSIGYFNYTKLLAKLPRISFMGLANNPWPCALEDEMRKLFIEDNFEFTLYSGGSTDHPACSDVPMEVAQMVVSEEFVQMSSAGSVMAWAFTLISIIILALAALFYMQFRLFQSVNRPVVV